MIADTHTSFKFLVFGAGAIGTYIGGSLALSGQSVVFIERPKVVGKLIHDGLHLSLRGKEYHIKSPVIVGSVEEAITSGPFDIAIFAVKSYDTQSTLNELAPYAVALPPFLCLQNGVENEMKLASVLGDKRVIPGSVLSAIGRRGSGDIVLEKLRGIAIASGHPLSSVVTGIFSAAGLNAMLSPNAENMKWSKMLTNLLANASAAILNMPPAEIFMHPGLYHLEIEQIREAIRVMDAQNIKLVDLPGTPVRALVNSMTRMPEWFTRPLIGRSLGKGRGGKMPSFHIDLHSGVGKSEVEYLNGAVVRFGEKYNISTPVNRLLTKTLMAMTKGEISLSEFSNQPDKLLKSIIV
jgi:2-dehydropantoate 2-reductase